MKKFARIQGVLVVELISIEEEQDITDFFHPSMIWIDVSDVEGIR